MDAVACPSRAEANPLLDTLSVRASATVLSADTRAG